MTRLLALVAALAAMLAVVPASAQQPGVRTTVLAEATQGTLPVGPLVWQGFEYVFQPWDRSQVFGEDAGFTWVVDGVAELQLEGEAPAAVPAGRAVATQSGVRRGLGGVEPTGAAIWVIGLGGPTPGLFQMPPRLLFRSEPIVPPGPGSYTFRLSRVEVTGLGAIAAEPVSGTVTLFVDSGDVSLQTPDGGAVLRQGAIVTIAASGGALLTPLGSRPASLVALTLVAGPPTVKVPVPSSTLPEFPSNPAPIPFPLLPSGTFPRR
ncbi:MAG: hypothetical protein U0556_10635 [Dehalococcoidia bacterium]